MEHRITDFVDPQAIQSLKDLNKEMQDVKETYISVAKELLKGLSTPTNNLSDLESLMRRFADLQTQAAGATQRHAQAQQQMQQVVANTTNTISRQLMEQERVNKTQRDAYTEHERVKKLLDQYHDTYENQVQSLVKINRELEQNKQAQKDVSRALAEGNITNAQYGKMQGELIARHRELTVEKRTLTQLMTAEEKAAQAQEGSYVQMAQQLELLKKAYKDLSEEGRNSDFGRELEESIQNLDAHLKDTAADMGEFQRNVGNYAIAGQNGVVATESLISVMEQEARTQQDLVDQTKILEEAKLMLNREDENYQSTLEMINDKLDDNRRRLLDVTDILDKEATSVAEAEAQNKRLAEAMKHIDLTSADAKTRLEQMRAQIDRNNATIAQATGQHEKFADGMLKMLGVNANFGSSLQGLSSGGNFLTGMTTKLQAFGKTLVGLVSNPWVLSFVGIAAAGAAFKWWYDYNKGLIEASRLTYNFTGATGEAADKVTADMQTLADSMGKGYSETISAANVLVQQFGVSWDAAYKLMQDGIVSGADMSGRMVQNIERFAPALRDAGVSADEFVAILAETRNGIFNEQGIQNIVKAGTRLRAMSKQTEDALNAVGISAKQMQADLEDGTLSMMDAVQQVAGKLQELPENSQEAGQIMRNVFGRTAAEGGTLLIQSIADVNTNLDEAKNRMGALGEINERQMNAQRKLQETLMAVFKASGTSFEELIGQAKTFAIEWLVAIIKGCVDIVNWFIRMYNNSLVVRAGVAAIVANFKILWEVCKFVVNRIIGSFHSMGEMLEGAFTLDWDKMRKGYHNGLVSLKEDVSSMVKNIASAAREGFGTAINGQLNEVSVELGGGGVSGSTRGGASGDGSSSSGGASGGGSSSGSLRQSAQDELAQMSQLIKARQDYISSQLSVVEKWSNDEKTLRLEALKAQHDAELLAITKSEREKTITAEQAADMRANLVEKYANLQTDIEAEYADNASKAKADAAKEYIDNLQEEYAIAQVIADNAMNRELSNLKKTYLKKLEEAGNSESARAQITEAYEREVADIGEKYAMQRVRATIEMIENMLRNEDISADEREKLERELAAAKIDLENQMADAAIAANKRIADSDQKTNDARVDNAQMWMQKAADGLNAISGLASAIFEGQIQQIEEEQEANTAAGEAEQERIADMVEKGVLTEEEGEARKRAAAAKTAQKEEELEKKKQQLKYKQAIWDKANSVAQIGISTALAIMNALKMTPFPLGVAMAAIAGAMGAVQLATVIATPIPKYAKGTDYHKGGLAIVGDAGREEVVSFGGNMFLTPDKPTLVDMPVGAKVYPDAEELVKTLGTSTAISAGDRGNTTIAVDFTRLERKLDRANDVWVENNTLLKKAIKTRGKVSLYAENERFKILKGL